MYEKQFWRTGTHIMVPPSKIDIFLDQYHTSLLGGHSGITKCYQMLKQKIYCPNLPYYVRLYIISCHICQLFKGSKKFDRPLMRRFYYINTPTMTNISMDIKHMPPSKAPYKYILVLLCEISNLQKKYVQYSLIILWLTMQCP